MCAFASVQKDMMQLVRFYLTIHTHTRTHTCIRHLTLSTHLKLITC